MKLVELNKHHIEEMIKYIRPEDKAEVVAMSGYDNIMQPMQDLLVYDSQEIRVALTSDHGLVYAIGGYSISGLVWFITSTHADGLSLQGRREFVKAVKKCKRLAFKWSDSPYLHNMVLSSNTKHVRLLKSLGAEFSAVERIGGLDFQQFFIWED